MHFMEENFCILIEISLKIVPGGPNNNKSEQVQVGAWRQTGQKTLPEPMMTKISNAIWHHQATMS